MIERRVRRSQKPHEAVTHFLDTLRADEKVEAVALSTEEGFLISGSGELDLEWIGAVGSAAKTPRTTWDKHTLHVRKLEVDGIPLFLTTAGKALSPKASVDGISRILGH